MRERPAITEVTKDKKTIVEVSDKVLSDITQRMIALEKDIEYLSEKVEVRVTERADDIDINVLVEKIQGIETDMEKIEETMDRLLDDKEKKETHINVRVFNKKIIKILFISYIKQQSTLD